MKKYYDSASVAKLDAGLISSGIPSAVLMENAGGAIARDVLELFPANGLPRRAVICVGAGNNGGDGIVVARRLALSGWAVTILLTRDREALKGDGAVFARFVPSSVRWEASGRLSDEEVLRAFDASDVVLDGLLGTGATGEPRGEIRRLIGLLNRSAAPCLSIDLPSGIESGGPWVQAAFTSSIAAYKASCASGSRRTACGRVKLHALCFGEADQLEEPALCGLERSDVAALAPRCPNWAHKGTRGGVLIFAGSDRYRGAALLSARGALRAGAGLVVLASSSSVLDAAAASLPDAILERLDDGSDAASVLSRWKDRCRAMIVGPGLGRDGRAEGVAAAAAGFDGSSVWDGDGLSFLPRLGTSSGRRCLTPHEGEAARLLGGWDFESAPDRRAEGARRLAGLFGPTLLKGPGSLVAGEKISVIEAGGRALAVPGSGDVLSGAVGAMLAAGLDCEAALVVAGWCHGRAGDRLTERLGADGRLAQEIADELPQCLNEVCS